MFMCQTSCILLRGGWGWLGGICATAQVMLDFKPKEDMGMMFIQAVTQATKRLSQFSQHFCDLINMP